MRDFDLEIRNKMDELVKLKESMEEAKINFKNQLNVFFTELYTKQSKKLVVENAEVAAGMGEDKLKLLKNEVQSLISDVPSIVDEHIDKEALWWHLRENTHTYSHYSEHRIPDFLEEECRYIYGKLGVVLSKYDLITIHDANYGVSRGTGSSFSNKAGKVRYTYGFDLNEDVKKELKVYATIHEKASGIRKEIEKIKMEKTQANIGNVWDSL